MNRVLGMKTPKRIENLLKERATLINEPYSFLIKGVTGYGLDRRSSAYGTFEKIKGWAEREGAEVSLIFDKYEDIHYKEISNRPLYQRLNKRYKSKGQSNGYLVVEITDPVARIIESIIN